MRRHPTTGASEEIARLARPLETVDDLAPLLERSRDARLVLVGEASHGTHEYYAWRAELTRRLIEEHGFDFVAVEGDWPDCDRVDRWIRGELEGSAREVLRRFERWPTWMWANEEVESFVAWLRAFNADRRPAERVGFHGIDVYSLWDSLRAIIGWLDVHDGEAAEAARRAWSCFAPYDEDPQEYAWATRVVPTSCEEEVVELLADLRRRVAAGDGRGEDRFSAERNAVAAAGAERYYRTMIRGGAESWNVRDRHMTETLEALLQHHGPGSRGVVWEHNTHVGDARFTDMARAGMVNVGQLVRERLGEDEIVLVGMGGYEGSVIAARAWGEPLEVMEVPPARPGSHEALLHVHGGPRSLSVFPQPDRQGTWLRSKADHRAIGVVYRHGAERTGNYVPTVLGGRYDAFLFFDATSALIPIARGQPAATREYEAFPSGR